MTGVHGPQIQLNLVSDPHITLMYSMKLQYKKARKTPLQSLLLCWTIRALCWFVAAQVEIYSGMKWIAQKHQKSMFESGKIRVRLAIEIMSHLDAYNFPAEWKAKWHVARFSRRSLFPHAACSRFPALPASPTHVCQPIYCALALSNGCWRIFIF